MVGQTNCMPTIANSDQAYSPLASSFDHSMVSSIVAAATGSIVSSWGPLIASSSSFATTAVPNYSCTAD